VEAFPVPPEEGPHHYRSPANVEVTAEEVYFYAATRRLPWAGKPAIAYF
jgi:hypothetical protein